MLEMWRGLKKKKKYFQYFSSAKRIYKSLRGDLSCWTSYLLYQRDVRLLLEVLSVREMCSMLLAHLACLTAAPRTRVTDAVTPWSYKTQTVLEWLTENKKWCKGERKKNDSTGRSGLQHRENHCRPQSLLQQQGPLVVKQGISRKVHLSTFYHCVSVGFRSLTPSKAEV